jgi:hypothetical protein
MLEKLLEQNCESEIIDVLLKIYFEKTKLSKSELIALNNFKTSNYALLGIIGLLLNEKGRIILGQKQPHNHQIKTLCLEIITTLSDLEIIADWDINRDLNEVELFVWTKVMLEYPNNNSLEA